MLRFKPGGLSQVFGPLECNSMHSSTCSHCQKITDFPSMKVMQNYVEMCRGCMKLICLDCAGKPCRPWEKECERLENEQRLRSKLESNWSV